MKKILRTPLTNNMLGVSDDWAKVGRGKILEPGIVRYDNGDGSSTTYLLTREAIAKGRPSAMGKPFIGAAGGFDHIKVNARDAANGKYDGEMVESYDGGDGWEWIRFVVRNPETIEKCRDGYQLSCAYIPIEVRDEPGLWHNIPFDSIIDNIEYTHTIATPSPRYEGANIELLNSMGGIVNKVLKAALSLVPMKDLKEIINSLDEEAKKKAEQEAIEKKNAEEKDAKRANAQSAYDAAMKNASCDEDRAKAKAAFEKANADLGAPEAGKEPVPAPVEAAEAPVGAPATDLPPQPLGGGDVTPEPGMPGLTPAKPPMKANAETPEGAAPVVTPAIAAEAAKEGETPAQEAAEQDAAKVALEKKNAEDAAAKKAEEERERKNALEKAKANAVAKAKADYIRSERFNALRKLADERGGNIGTPFVGHVSAQDKEDLGRDRYGSRVG